jgi:sugar phosphate isomerase/epimerase
MAPPALGVQMWTVRDYAIKDYRWALERIAALGYRGVEVFDLYGYAATDIQRMAADLGLAISSALVRLPVGADPHRIVDNTAGLGVAVMSCGLREEEFESKETIARGANRVNDAASVAAEYGIQLAYHNHTAEFAKRIDGHPSYDVLWECLDERIVAEVDVYWAKLGGADPSEVLKSLGKRAEFLHVKDGPANDPLSPMVAVGEGSLDMAAIMSAAQRAKWHLVELDHCEGDVFEALADSFNFLVDGGFSQGRADWP